MIISCPECATRYSVEDDRFFPDGRSVRCSSCGESWFVPPPETLEAAPIDEFDQGRNSVSSHAGRNRSAQKGAGIKVGVADAPPTRHQGQRAGAPMDSRSDEDDRLFDAPRMTPRKERARPADRQADNRAHEEAPAQDWRKARQFIDRDAGGEEFAEGSSYAGRRQSGAEGRRPAKNARPFLRFADLEDDTADARTSDYSEDDADFVDADWEDLEDNRLPRGFGRRTRQGDATDPRYDSRRDRRGATALTRVDDQRPLDPDALDDEFFSSLKVTPRELERAIRKARRRAESRDKNRLTPFRALGWAAWVAAVAGAAYGAVAFRDNIVKLAPQTADAYAVIGIEANPYGLAIEDVSHRLAMSTAGPTIEITGRLRNQSDGAVAAPLLQAEALGARGELLARWTFSANEAEVAHGAAVDFVTRAAAPEGVSEVALSFAPAGSVLDSLLPGAE